jgi:hypothetical protein
LKVGGRSRRSDGGRPRPGSRPHPRAPSRPRGAAASPPPSPPPGNRHCRRRRLSARVPGAGALLWWARTSAAGRPQALDTKQPARNTMDVKFDSYGRPRGGPRRSPVACAGRESLVGSFAISGMVLGRRQHFPGRTHYSSEKSAFYTTTGLIGGGYGETPPFRNRWKCFRDVSEALTSLERQ